MVANVIIGVVLCYGGLRGINGDVKIGVLATFLLYLQRFFDPLQDVSQFYNSFQGAASALEKISGVLEEEPSVAEPAAPLTLPAATGRRVQFESVRFGYRPAGSRQQESPAGLRQQESPAGLCQQESRAVVLPGFGLDIPAGQTVALVGETGAGKTTIARLLARFYDP